MSNNYFQFKRFIVRQDKSSMKVGTDGCLLGAWSPLNHPEKILDVGSGTGLVSLMIAQRMTDGISDFHIDAIDIDQSSFEQSLENFNNSLWGNCISAIHADFLTYETNNYDLIICNPPFYKNALASPDASRNLARNESVLPFDSLVSKVAKCMNPEGMFVVIFPYEYYNSFRMMAEGSGLYPCKVLFVYPTPNKSCKRVVVAFSRLCPDIVSEETIVIQNEGSYTEEYKDLMKDFYLWI